MAAPDRTILQIISAPGWYARFRDVALKDVTIDRPLSCWVLIEELDPPEPPARFVSGMELSGEGTLGTELCADDDDFLEYVHADNVRWTAPRVNPVAP